MRVGLVGESPYDTLAIKNLLSKKYSDLSFKVLAEGVTGCQLDSPKLSRAISVALRNEPFDVILYMRDLDGFRTQTSKIEELNNWYNKLNEEFGGNGLFLLNIWELEALILADIDTFNKNHKTSHQFKGDPSMQSRPKETLQRITKDSRKKYTVSRSPEIFNQLDINTVERNCVYFRQFLKQFSKAVSVN